MYAEQFRKKCTKCNKLKNISYFYKNKRYTDGYHGWCKNCKLESARKHKDTVKNWHKKNAERVKQIKQKYVDSNKEKVIESKKKWAKKNPKKMLANCREYQLRKKQCSPKWSDKKVIQKFYENCPKGMEVDHIIPIRGKNICGLHVIWNLQYLKRSANRKKSNSY